MGTLKLRSPTSDDRDVMFEWRNDPRVRQYSRNTGLIAYEDHLTWFANLPYQHSLKVFVAYDDEIGPIGVISYRRHAGALWPELSLYVGSPFIGKGKGKDLLDTAMRYGYVNYWFNGYTLSSHVDNKAATALYVRFGLKQQVTIANFNEWWMPRWKLQYLYSLA